MNSLQTRNGAIAAPRQSNLKRTVRTLMLATALTTTTVGVTSTVAVPGAEAFGWSDIKKTAKKAHGAVKKGAGKITGTVDKAGGVVKKRAVGTVKGAGKVLKGVGDAGMAVAREVVVKPVAVGLPELYLRATGDFNEYEREISKDVRREIDEGFNLDTIGRGLKKGGKKVGKIIIGKNKIGESLPVPDKSKAESALVDYMNRRGGITRKTYGGGVMKPGIVKGGARNKIAVIPLQQNGIDKTGPDRGWVKNIRRKSAREKLDGLRGKRRPGKFQIGIVDDGKFHTGKRKKPLGHDKSVWGNPVGGHGPSRPAKPVVRPVQGIRLDDLKPGRKPGRHQSGREIIGHDKSAYGRPIYRKKIRKALGVTKDNLKRPGRKPYWKEYRENPPKTKDLPRRLKRTRLTKDLPRRIDRKRLTKDLPRRGLKRMNTRKVQGIIKDNLKRIKRRSNRIGGNRARIRKDNRRITRNKMSNRRINRVRRATQSRRASQSRRSLNRKSNVQRRARSNRRSFGNTRMRINNRGNRNRSFRRR